ncbi:uncharacterized protein LOC106646139, partial [Copidosoma floridanum]|uniref:uncharacterized protein LOC106646139 n=1 Tax=Copidosoma floridanum TaxID=29053 RepID=UPI0006C967AA
ANSRSIRLEILPRDAVEQGHDATLRCHYDLDGKPLFALKWYRGEQEIYRYLPSLTPAIKIFNYTWIQIDPHNSTENQVVIKNVDFQLTGNFSCETTTDSESFYTQKSSKFLTVVSIPKDKPVIMSERAHYSPGDTLKANCSTTPSKPLVTLSFTLNGAQVKDTETKQSLEKHDYSGYSAGGGRSPRQGKQWSEISLQLQPFHYTKQGHLNLLCIAKIPNIYEQASEVLHLGTGVGDPVPERVTSKVVSNSCHRIADLTLVALIIINLRHLR